MANIKPTAELVEYVLHITRRMGDLERENRRLHSEITLLHEMLGTNQGESS